MIKVTFNEQEMQALVQMLDLAVKAGGLNVAGAAFILQQKIVSAFEADNRLMTEPDPTKPNPENN